MCCAYCSLGYCVLSLLLSESRVSCHGGSATVTVSRGPGGSRSTVRLVETKMRPALQTRPDRKEVRRRKVFERTEEEPSGCRDEIEFRSRRIQTPCLQQQWRRKPCILPRNPVAAHCWA
uniref:Putative secreted protein n=1 Tax=Anopheles darlingi TaxID=43151 RepID=A0A2M4DH61_ANODA